VSFTTLRPHVDQFMVLASDGVWDMLPNELVCDLVTGVGGAAGRTRAMLLLSIS
jgi:serine/threonine protein phosphatase PrpC